ncbi:MAG: 3-phosphoshikimate 1-carboxyvinyltransferase [Hamadaea sp.]|uniref:3-phosphoshikimate 1-carboxyvinyltransferase n=1 Tax=Hamadaea sp. TaxID=2024425 RepID=UPI00185D7B86|nr:3-phosphoshikimate 1-carboxyvinyltransferase [Hamadaea sp.]NUR69788.1 3-phosphoshikimate 1-carboxyvinyltransferase [Hamadaea sp.]NUT22629.1 3-phosphoshikimate 1-carboxyvinyltransferase [Hamadaea sp.]
MTKRAVPWTAPTAIDPLNARVRLPGSKSMTTRALVLAAISTGTSTLDNPLRARDTELMAAGLRSIGVNISTVDDERWVVRPRPLTGPAHIDVGTAGSVMRFLPPLAGLASGAVTFDGTARARQRPLGPLVAALRAIGVRLDAGAADGLPLTVYGQGRVRGGDVSVDASPSSQLLTGLLLAAPDFDRGLTLKHTGPALPRAPHLRLTVEMLRAAGAAVDDATPDAWRVEPARLAGRSWLIEPDLATIAPFLAAALVVGGRVTVPGWPRSTLQAGHRLRAVLTRMGGSFRLTEKGMTVRGGPQIRGIDVDLRDQAELSPVIAALAALADGPSTLRGLAHLRTQENDQVAALARELSALGAGVTEHEDGLTVEPHPLTGTVFETYDDHRMAHAAALLGLKVPGVVLSDVACTAKTLPDFPALWSAMVGASS